jgi:hypothetical protein
MILEDIEQELDAQNQENDAEEKDDVIASAFFDLLTDDGLDFLWELVGSMVDSGEIDEVPEESAPEEQKQEWLEKNLPKIEAAFQESLGYDDDVDQEDEEEGA